MSSKDENDQSYEVGYKKPPKDMKSLKDERPSKDKLLEQGQPPKPGKDDGPPVKKGPKGGNAPPSSTTTTSTTAPAGSA